MLLTVFWTAGIALASPKKVQAEDSVEFMESKLNRAMDELNKKERIGIYGDMITLEKVEIEEADGEDKSRAESDPLLARVDEFLRCRKLQIRLPSDGSAADMFGRALGERNIDFELRGLTGGASQGENSEARLIFNYRSW